MIVTWPVVHLVLQSHMTVAWPVVYLVFQCHVTVTWPVVYLVLQCHMTCSPLAAVLTGDYCGMCSRNTPQILISTTLFSLMRRGRTKDTLDKLSFTGSTILHWAHCHLYNYLLVLVIFSWPVRVWVWGSCSYPRAPECVAVTVELT